MPCAQHAFMALQRSAKERLRPSQIALGLEKSSQISKAGMHLRVLVRMHPFLDSKCSAK